MRKNVLKVFATLLSVILVATLFVGCGNGDADYVTIEWWTPNWNEDASREMADEFMAENPDVKVELVITDWETYRASVTTAISTDNAPEIFTILLTDVKPLADLGFLQPLNDFDVLDPILADIIPAALAIGTIDGDIYAIPHRYDGSGIFYNVDILTEAGFDTFPATWDEMMAMAEVLAEDGRPAFAWPLGNQAEAVTRFIQQLYSYDGSILNADETASVLDGPAARQALGNIVNSIQAGIASPNSLELNNTMMRNMFGTGQIAFNFTGPFDIDTLLEEYPDLNFRTAVIPGDGGMGVTTANGWCIAMGANSNNQEAAARFLAYINLPDNQVRLTDSFPGSMTAIEFDDFATEHLRPFAEQLTNSRVEPIYSRWAEIEPIIFNYIQQAVAGTITVDEAITNMSNDIDLLLGS